MCEQQEAGTEQKAHWDKVFSDEAVFFGEEPSDFAKKSVDLFRREAIETVLELGCGQGRDTLFFARCGLRVTALDYSETAVSGLRQTAAAAGLAASIVAQSHDVRQPLPFPDGSFDACYSHMLLCMELSTAEIAFLLGEIRRVLRPDGFALYSVRSSLDKHYRTGTHLHEEIYKIGGFAVHFFTEEKIRRIARGYAIEEIERMEEGSLPRDLFCVTLRKVALDHTEEEKSHLQTEIAPAAAATPETTDPDPGRT
jgi:SAM-dependent methyltransferase